MYVNINLKNGPKKDKFGSIKSTWVESDWSIHPLIIASPWALLIPPGSPALKVEKAKFETISFEANG